MINRSTLSGTLFCIALLAAGCGSPSSSTDKASAEPPSPAAEPATTVMTAPAPTEDAPVETPASAPETVAAAPVPLPVAAPAVTPTTKPPVAAPAAVPAKLPAPALAVTTPTPAPAPKAATPAAVAATPPPAAPAATSAIADPGGTVAVAATKPGIKRVGAEACGDCHDVQFESWSIGAHAKRTPPLDCENCHGPGSEYKSKAVMKDPAKAKAAGLVMPDKDFCAKCHKKGVDDAFMKKAHAHDE